MADQYPDWPSGLPYAPLLDGYSVDQPFIPPDITDMDAGNTRMRSKYTVHVSKEPISIRLKSDEQYETFRLWARDTLGGGASKFHMKVRVAGSWVDRVCFLDGGQYKAEPAGMADPDVGTGYSWTISFTRAVENM